MRNTLIIEIFHIVWMSEVKLSPKLRSLKNFLTKPESEESKNYISNLLEGKLKRPEESIVNEFLSKEFWNELGYSRDETNFEAPEGVTGMVEWALEFENKKIAKERNLSNSVGSRAIGRMLDQGFFTLKEQQVPITSSNTPNAVEQSVEPEHATEVVGDD